MSAKLAAALAALAGVALAAVATAQHAGHGAPATPARPSAPVPMEQLHRMGGVPRGWTFTLPAGDPKTGRDLFAKLECYKCHAAMPDFPRAEGTSGDVGPELTGMGGHHPAEYFAQSIVDPNAVIVAGAGFVGPDGRSVMPDYRDSLTFGELAHLVAYLKSLDRGGHGHHGRPAREQTGGPYRVRVEYDGATHGHAHGAPSQPHGGHGQGGHGHGGGAARNQTGHLMVFIVDAATGESVPYLPVTAVIATGKAASQSVRLVPMLGDGGFHYGADVALPSTTTSLTVTVGPAALKTTGAAAARFATPVTLSFDWSD